MLTVLGSLLGFAGSAVPSIIDMFKEKEDATHLLALEAMRELGWNCADE